MPQLRKKPLVEAIFEFKWTTASASKADPFREPDPNYKLHLGRVFDRLQARYPFHEALPTAQIPDQLVAFHAQHRFRTADGQWPLIQLGPGIMTLNETENYTWADFSQRALEAIDVFRATHPNAKDVQPTSVALRYIDAISLATADVPTFDFLRNKLQVGISLPDALFQKHKIAKAPTTFQWQAAFASQQPAGVAALKLGLGTIGNSPSVILDTSIQSEGAHAPSLNADFDRWLVEAHDVTSEWFKDLTAGELYASFEPV